MQSVSDQLDKIIAWVILTLVSAVTFLVGWIFKEQLERIASRFVQVELIFNERLKQAERLVLARLDQQDKDLREIQNDFVRLHDRLDNAARPEHSRSPPRGTIQDRGRKQDQDRNSSDEF